MFNECSSLEELNVSSFNTNKVYVMDKMFFGCSSLKDLDLTNFNTNPLLRSKNMLDKCSDELNLKLKLSSCFNLFGEKGQLE